MFSLHKTYEITYGAGYNKGAGRRFFMNIVKEQAKKEGAGWQNFLKTVREHAPLLESSEYPLRRILLYITPNRKFFRVLL